MNLTLIHNAFAHMKLYHLDTWIILHDALHPKLHALLHDTSQGYRHYIRRQFLKKKKPKIPTQRAQPWASMSISLRNFIPYVLITYMWLGAFRILSLRCSCYCSNSSRSKKLRQLQKDKLRWNRESHVGDIFI